ncbi:hypothetical protein H6G91_11645 [Nostoc muscorum FACHB-395]|jgi:hypothetical protein|nr:hypothetical protein [Desmonostoc muscorum FACHB-395]
MALRKAETSSGHGMGGVEGWGGNAVFVDMQLFNFSSLSPHFPHSPHSPHSKSKLYQGFAINKRAIRSLVKILSLFTFRNILEFFRANLLKRTNRVRAEKEEGKKRN